MHIMWIVCCLFKTNYFRSFCNQNKIQKKKKTLVLKDLLEAFSAYFKFVHNKSIEFDATCTISKYRPDFLRHGTTHFIVIECDEHHNVKYPCVWITKREHDICIGLGTPSSPKKHKNIDIKSYIHIP